MPTLPGLLAMIPAPQTQKGGSISAEFYIKPRQVEKSGAWGYFVPGNLAGIACFYSNPLNF